MSDYTGYIIDHLQDWGPARARRMFGGYGIFRSDVMFALIAYDQLYLKSDGEAEKYYIDASCDQFIYEAKGKRIKMSYWSAPDSFFEDPEETQKWADIAFEAALRADAVKKNKKKIKKKTL